MDTKKQPWALVMRPVWSGGRDIFVWHVMNQGDTLNSNGVECVVELVSLEDGVIWLKEVDSERRNVLYSDEDCSKFNIHWKPLTEFEKVIS